MNVTKKSYQAPKLEEWGSVVDLTQAGQTNPLGDAAFGGSVFAPGLDDNPGFGKKP